MVYTSLMALCAMGLVKLPMDRFFKGAIYTYIPGACKAVSTHHVLICNQPFAFKVWEFNESL